MIVIDDLRTELAHTMLTVTIEEETREIPLDPAHYFYPTHALSPSMVGHQLVGRSIHGTTICGLYVFTGDPGRVFVEGSRQPQYEQCLRCLLSDPAAPPATRSPSER